MTQIVYPPADVQPWPTLGPAVCQFIEENLVHGPGDLLGDPVKLDEEQKAWIYRMYEVEPEYSYTKKGGRRSKYRNARAGQRRFERCVLSLRKGSNKTELAAWLAAVELHPWGPVRCDGFDADGTPIPRPVKDPYIPMISFTEEQTEELAYGALRRILQECALGRDFDIGLQRIMRLDGHGKAEAVSASPNARDGARTTFEHADETHRFILEHHRRAWSVMLANLAKRPIADPWALETTTAPEPGAGSMAEATMHFAEKLSQNGKGQRSRFFFFHREASPDHDLQTEKGLKAAIVEASGPYVAAWSDVDRIASRFRNSDADLAYLERVWLNRPVQAAVMAFDALQWRALGRPGRDVKDGESITLGFDGSRYEDATALIGTTIKNPHQFVVGIWERPPEIAEWEVPVDEVNGAVADAFQRWKVMRMYCDPPKWESWVAAWAGKYGDKIVAEWWTNRRKPMAYALKAYDNAIRAREMSHDGNQQFAAHVGNGHRSYTNLVDEDGRPLWILRKERPDSPRKIDAAMAGVLSWEARMDAIAAGAERKGVWAPL
jgi:hypothetical protein